MMKSSSISFEMNHFRVYKVELQLQRSIAKQLKK